MLVTSLLAVLEFFVLAIGFGIGFWLLINATKEIGWKKILGLVFAWILIIYSVILALMITFSWVDYIRSGKTMQGCPMHMMMQKNNQERSMMNKMNPQSMQKNQSPMMQNQERMN